MDKSNSAEDPKGETTIEELPDFVFDEVLIRVPFPYLNESRLVSRAWHERISHRSFVESVKSKHGNKATMCVHEVWFGCCEPDIVTLKLFPISSETYTYSPLEAARYPHILGSVNDMVLFGNHDCSHLYMINPTSHTLWMIDGGPESYGLFGFGYNQAESYVIVKLVQDQTDNSAVSAYVYSHRRRAWGEKKILNKLEHRIEGAVGYFDGRIYFHACDSLLGFELGMEGDFWVIQLPEDLRDQPLTFGVAREEISSEHATEVLLIGCHNYSTNTSSMWRLRRENNVEVFNVIAVWDNFDHEMQPLAYYLGDPNQIVILEDSRSIVLYNVAERFKFEIYCKEDQFFSTIHATAFYHTGTKRKTD